MQKQAYMPCTLTFWLLLAVGNALIWLPVLWADFPTIGLGHDSQLFSAAINAGLRGDNMPWQLTSKLLAAREDVFSYPYFGILYPFYWTLGVTGNFDYFDHLLLDFLSIVFHLTVASICFAMLLRRMGCQTVVAVIFGLFYGYSLHLKMWSSWIWAISGYSWIPLCLLGVWICVCERRYRVGVLCLSMGFGLIALGTALPLVYATILSGVFFIALLLKEQPKGKTLVHIFLSMGVAGTIALMIGASHLLPTLHRAAEYIRWYSGGAIVGALKPPYEGTLATTLDWSWATLLEFFAPIHWSGGVGNLYLGSSIVVLAAYYCYRHWNSLLIWPLIFVAGYFFLDAFGDATFIHRITYQLPLLGSIRYPLANVIIPIVILLIFSALGLTQLLDKADTKSNKQRQIITLIMVVLGVITAIYLTTQKSALIQPFYGKNFWLMLLPMAAVIIWFASLMQKRYLALVPVALLVLQLPQNSMLFHPKIPQNNSLILRCDTFSELYSGLIEAKTNLQQASRLAIDISLGPDSRETCRQRFRLPNTLIQSLATMAGWDVLQLYQSPRPIKEFRLFRPYGDRGQLMNQDAVLQAGITHVLVDQPLPVDDPRSQFYINGRPIGEFMLYEIANSAVGLTATGCIQLSANSKTAQLISSVGQRLLTQPIDAQQLQAVLCNSENSAAKSQLQLTARNASTLEYTINADQPTLFISDQVFSHHWKVSINGKPTPTFAIDRYRLATTLPAGESIVELNYQPRDLKIGVFFSYLGLLCWLIIGMLPVITQLRQKVFIRS